MRITIVTGPFYSPPPGRGGAVERLWEGLGRRFAARGHAVTLVSRRQGGQARREAVGGVGHRRATEFRTTRSFPLNLGLDALYSARAASMLPPADVTVTNAFWLPPMARWLRRRRAGRVSVNVNRVPKGQLFLYRGADQLTAPSRLVLDKIARQAPYLSPRSVLLPNPIDTDAFRDDGTPEPAVPTVGYTGRVHPEKGLHLLFGAYRRLKGEFPDLKLRVVGPWRVEGGGGGQPYRDRLLGIAPDAEFVEPTYDPRELARYIRGMSVYCYPSVADGGETFGCAPLEAMACGRPTVVSGLAAFDDYLRDGDNGLRFDHRAPDAEEQLADRIAGLLRSAETRRRLAAAGAATGAGYSYDAVADLALDSFARLLDGGDRQ